MEDGLLLGFQQYSGSRSVPSKQARSISPVFSGGVNNEFGAKSWRHDRALFPASLLPSFSVGVGAGGGPRPKNQRDQRRELPEQRPWEQC